MVAINSLTMLFFYGPLGGFLLGVGKLPVPWQALLLSIAIYVALPLVAGYLSRKWIIAVKGEPWFREKFLHFLTPVTIIALLATLVLLFSFKGEVILSNPLTILWIAIPLFIQTNLIFWIGYLLSKPLKLSYRNRNGDNALRPILRRSPGHRRRSPHRGPRNADAGKDLP